MPQTGDILIAIGSLQARADGMDGRMKGIDGKLDIVVDALSDLKYVVGRLNRIEPMVDEHERLNIKGRGFMAGFALAGGSVGAGVWEVGKMIARKLGIL